MEFALRAAVGSGMRRGEIVGLDVRDIDFEAGEIHVVHGTDSLGRQKDTKTAASKRALPMPASLKADLRERIAAIEEMFAETRKETGSPWPVLGDDTPLMCNELGERMRPHSVTRWWECHRDGYGCQGMTLHDMRHSYLTAMARKKTDPKVLRTRRWRRWTGNEVTGADFESILLPFGLGKRKRSEAFKPLTWCFMVRDTRFELVTPTVSRWCSPPELIAHSGLPPRFRSAAS